MRLSKAYLLCRQAKEDLLNSQDINSDAMGPVVESVLGSLTQEYEKRLLAKDHEVKAAQHEVKAAQTALKQAQSELYEAHKSLADNANRLPVCGPQPGDCLETTFLHTDAS